MHPQIQNPGPGKCPLCGMDLIPNDLSSSSDNPAIFSMNEAAAQLANIRTSTVEFTDPRKEILLQGKVEMDETRASSQSIHFSGRIEKLHVAFEGEHIKKGQKLASVYSPELISAQKELLEALKTQSTYPQLHEAARNKLRLWKVSDPMIRNIEETGKIVEVIDIYSEVSGYVVSKKVSPGDYVKGGQVLFDLIDLNSVWVNFDAYESDIAFIQLHDTIRFTLNAFPSKAFTGTVRYIDPLIDKKSRTISVRTEVGNPDQLLKPEMFVYGRLQASLETGKALTVPKSAVMWTGERSIVYVKLPGQSEPTFELREVKLGESLGESYIIRKGLMEGEEVVTQGTFTVDAAAQLSNKYSMMNLPASADDHDFAETVPSGFKAQLQDLLLSYLALKQAMVNTDPMLTRQCAKTFMELLSRMDQRELTDPMKAFWNIKVKSIGEKGGMIAESGDMEVQRAAFKPFSASVIEVYKSFGTGLQVYVQYCPMADEDRGGYWLSDKKNIENPYFGDLMMECGEVKELLY